ncbi:MAG: BACON domain-containing protein [Bacteroidales bacterium]|nr:BACON domain-containing protein [Bacteroidales bacterium]
MAQINNWLSVDKNSGTGNAEITLTASSYEELVERTATIKVQGINTNAILTVKQEALVPNITLSTYSVESNYDGASFSITVTSNVPWSATVGEGDWFSVNRTSGDKGPTSVVVTMTPNVSDSYKTSYMNFMFGDTVLATLIIGQKQKLPLPKAANRIYYTTTDGNSLSFSPQYITDKKYIGSGMDGDAYYWEYDGEITSLAKDAFRSNKFIKRLSLPSSLRVIEDSSIFDCVNLEEVDCGGNELYVGISGLASNGVYFENATQYRKFEVLNFPKTLVYVGGCGLEEAEGDITFGADLQNLSGAALKGSYSDIYFYGNTPPNLGTIYWVGNSMYVGTFFGYDGNIHIPIGSDYSVVRNFDFKGEIISDLVAETPTTYDDIMVFGDNFRVTPTNNNYRILFYSPKKPTLSGINDELKTRWFLEELGGGWYSIGFYSDNTYAEDSVKTITVTADNLSKNFNVIALGGKGFLNLSKIDSNKVEIKTRNWSISSITAKRRVTGENVDITVNKYPSTAEDGTTTTKCYIYSSVSLKYLDLYVTTTSDKFGNTQTSSISLG